VSLFVLDASVTVAWCFEDEATDYTDRALDALIAGQQAAVPPLWFYETANVLLGAMRTKRLTAAKVTSFLQHLLTFAITVDSESPQRVFPEGLALAEAHGLTVYDAAYLELALRKGVPLLTVDRDLKKAARAAGIPTAIA